MSYSFEKDDKGKSFEMKLDNATILTAFVTKDSDSGMPEVADGYYGGIGEGVMSGDWTPAGGGGGSSYFTTAVVTFTNADTSTSYNVRCIETSENEGIVNGNVSVSNENVDVDVILYKGIFKLPMDAFSDVDLGYMPTCSGSIEMEHGCFVITGNGTITAKGQSVNN